MSSFEVEPSAEVGEELREFFVQLLSPHNLVSYSQGRESYITSRQSILGTEATRILREGSLAEIEANVALATTSSEEPPIVICIIWPIRG